MLNIYRPMWALPWCYCLPLMNNGVIDDFKRLTVKLCHATSSTESDHRPKNGHMVMYTCVIFFLRENVFGYTVWLLLWFINLKCKLMLNIIIIKNKIINVQADLLRLELENKTSKRQSNSCRKCSTVQKFLTLLLCRLFFLTKLYTN